MGATALTDRCNQSEKMLANREESIYGLRHEAHQSRSMRFLRRHHPTKTFKLFEEWEIPREADAQWPDAAKKLHAQWWEQRIARQQEIDKSIAAKADFEFLYDKPYDNKKIVRVAGPFTVESLSPHRMLGVDENDELIDRVAEPDADYDAKQSFPQMILENLKTAGVQQAHKEDKIIFTALTPWPGDLVCAEGRYVETHPSPQPSPARGEGEKRSAAQGLEPSPPSGGRGEGEGGGVEKRAAIFIGPEFGTVTRPDLVAAAREAGDADFDVLIACAFNYEAHATEFSKLGRIPVLKARMNADLHMAEDLKNTGKGNLFVIFGEPDVEVASEEWLVDSDEKRIAPYEIFKLVSGVDSLAKVNRLGREDLRLLAAFPPRRDLGLHRKCGGRRPPFRQTSPRDRREKRRGSFCSRLALREDLWRSWKPF